MLLEFTKMHGLGNDFVVVDLISQRAYLDTTTIQRMADRHFGIGFDQLLIVEPPDICRAPAGALQISRCKPKRESLNLNWDQMV